MTSGRNQQHPKLRCTVRLQLETPGYFDGKHRYAILRVMGNLRTLERPVLATSLFFGACTRNIVVRKRGLEPLWVSPPDPKSGASANSATFAFPCIRTMTRCGDTSGSSGGP